MSFAQTKSEVLNRLSQAITQLEDAVFAAKDTIENKPEYPLEAIERLDHYLEIVAQQRSTLLAISDLMDAGNMEQLAIEVHKVNGLSAMIRDDARELLGVLANPQMRLVRPDSN
jgi:hypothetical protein